MRVSHETEPQYSYDDIYLRLDPARSPSVSLNEWAHVRDGLTAAIADANRSGRPTMITVQNLHITQVTIRDAVVVTVAGEVDLGTVGLLTQSLLAAGLIGQPPRMLVVDLNAVTFFGAVGLTSLVMADHRCHDQGVDFRIVANSRVVLRPLEMTGLIETLPVVPALQPDWARRGRTIRATRAILDAARRILMTDRRSAAKKPPSRVD